MKNVGNIELNTSDPEFISEPTHRIKALPNHIFFIARNTKKDNPIGVHMYDALHINIYWRGDCNQQRGKYFMDQRKEFRHPFSIYLIITIFVVKGAK